MFLCCLSFPKVSAQNIYYSEQKKPGESDTASIVSI